MNLFEAHILAEGIKAMFASDYLSLRYVLLEYESPALRHYATVRYSSNKYSCWYNGKMTLVLFQTLV